MKLCQSCAKLIEKAVQQKSLTSVCLESVIDTRKKNHHKERQSSKAAADQCYRDWKHLEKDIQDTISNASQDCSFVNWPTGGGLLDLSIVENKETTIKHDVYFLMCDIEVLLSR